MTAHRGDPQGMDPRPDSLAFAGNMNCRLCKRHVSWVLCPFSSFHFIDPAPSEVLFGGFLLDSFSLGEMCPTSSHSLSKYYVPTMHQTFSF